MPKDTSGHGGGFVFDCRGVLNPGRMEIYKTQTGRDYPVQEYLLNKTRMPQFLENVFGTVDITINDYLQRGFDQLTISFGCTGGQHRSVFAAEQMKVHLKEIYNIDAAILHLEQDENQHERR
jgi:RNase adaptor protein for sRNA GlmZ degradation